jgi:hypothetical protein
MHLEPRTSNLEPRTSNLEPRKQLLKLLKLPLFLALILVFFQNSKILAQTYVWDGSSSTAWDDYQNWHLGGSPAITYPMAGDDVLIGHFNSPTYWPEITSTDACRHLEFTNNGHIDFGSGGILTVRGDIVSNTSNPFTCFDLEEGTVLIQGSLDHDLDGFIGFSTLEIDCDGFDVDITAESEVLVHEYVNGHTRQFKHQHAY